MTETEADDYNLNSEGRQQTLHISLVNDKQIAMILLNKITNQQHSNYLTLQSLKNLSKAFAGVKTIKEALKIVKDTIESGNIALIEEYCEKNLAKYMLPKEYVFRESLPKTMIGKVDYRTLENEDKK